MTGMTAAAGRRPARAEADHVGDRKVGASAEDGLRRLPRRGALPLGPALHQPGMLHKALNVALTGWPNRISRDWAKELIPRLSELAFRRRRESGGVIHST